MEKFGFLCLLKWQLIKQLLGKVFLMHIYIYLSLNIYIYIDIDIDIDIYETYVETLFERNKALVKLGSQGCHMTTAVHHLIEYCPCRLQSRKPIYLPVF